MKRAFTVILALAMLLVLIPLSVSSAETVDDLISSYHSDMTLDERLDLIWRIAVENAKTPSVHLGQVSNVPLGDAFKDVLPEDWETYPHSEAETFPEEAKGHRCVVIESKNQLGARFLVSFPEEMIARSVEEAEYAVVIYDQRVESGYEYNIQLTTYHWDYYAFLLNLQTGEAVQFWYNRQWAGRYGYANELDAKPMTKDQIWQGIRTGIVNQLRAEQADGSVLILGIEDGTCYVKGYEGDPVDIVIPAEAEGYAVTKFQAECFKNCKTLKSVYMPDSMTWISSGVFDGCSNLETVHFPEGLEGIGKETFQNTALTEVVLPARCGQIGESAFCHCDRLVSVTLPSSVRNMKIGDFAFHYCNRLSRMILPEGIWYISTSYYISMDENMLYVYYPESLFEGLTDHNFNTSMTVYTPKGSYAAQWAEENGLTVVECSDPSEVPEVRFVEEGPFDFRITGDEAQLQYYNETDELEEVIIPAEVDGCPVTTILSNAFDYMANSVRVIRLPESVLLVKHMAIEFQGHLRDDLKGELYIPNPETVLENYSVNVSMADRTSVTLFAPAGSSAEQYVEKRAELNPQFNGTFHFSEWSE